MYQRFLVFLRQAWHAHAIFWARDETEKSAKRNCVVLAPHPDDETIGMGATIARKKAAGTNVVLVVATDGRYSQISKKISTEKLIEIRKQELLQATKALGLEESEIFFVDEVDTKINNDRLEKQFNKILDSLDFKVEEIISTSWFDSHQDHQACAAIAKKVSNERSIQFRACPIYWWANGPSRSHREKHSTLNKQFGKLIDIKRAFFERPWKVKNEEFENIRLQALDCYKTQTTNFTDEDSWTKLNEEWLKTFNRRSEIYIKQ